MSQLTWSHLLLIGGTLLLATLAATVVGWIGSMIATRAQRLHNSKTAMRLRGPIVLALAVGGWQLALVFIEVPGDARETLHDVGRIGIAVAVVWLVLRLADLVVERLAANRELFAHHAVSRALLPLGRRVTKIAVVTIAVIAVLGSLGYSATGLIAGLGIGGIAVALAAQKTLENVLGAFALGIDQPLREGDFIKVDQTLGTVERIGMRSTRLRTLDRTLVAYPNGKLADSVIERFSARDRFRFDVHFRIGLGVTSAQLRQIRDRIASRLESDKARAADPPAVHITGPGDAWVELEAMAWFTAKDFGQFQTIRDQILFDCFDIIERAGAWLNGAITPPTPTAVNEPIALRR